jgi:hypothetical protein
VLQCMKRSFYNIRNFRNTNNPNKPAHKNAS